MAALPATPEPVIRLKFYHSIDSALLLGNHVDVFYSGSAPSSVDLSVIAADVATAWGANLKGLLSSSGLLAKVGAIDLANPGTVEGEAVVSIAGTRAGNIPTLASALVQVFHPAVRYRGSRPKTFWPFGTVNDVSGANTWTSGFTTTAAADLDAFLEELLGVTSGEATLSAPAYVKYYHKSTVVVNPTTGRARNVPTVLTPPQVYDVISWSLQTQLGSQRKRLNAA